MLHEPDLGVTGVKLWGFANHKFLATAVSCEHIVIVILRLKLASSQLVFVDFTLFNYSVHQLNQEKKIMEGKGAMKLVLIIDLIISNSCISFFSGSEILSKFEREWILSRIYNSDKSMQKW